MDVHWQTRQHHLRHRHPRHTTQRHLCRRSLLIGAVFSRSGGNAGAPGSEQALLRSLRVAFPGGPYSYRSNTISQERMQKCLDLQGLVSSNRGHDRSQRRSRRSGNVFGILSCAGICSSSHYATDRHRVSATSGCVSSRR